MDEISNFEKLIKIAGFTASKHQNQSFFFFFKYIKIFVRLTMSAV